MSTLRYTLKTIRSGQPRAYADSERVVQIHLENDDWRNPGTLKPMYVDESRAKEIARQLPLSGFIKTLSHERGHGLESYLDYFRPLDATTSDKIIPHGDPKQTVASIWEFRVVSPFTD